MTRSRIIFSDLHSSDVVVLDVVLVQRHEDDVDGDAEGDEELGEGVEDDEGEHLGDLEPEPAAVPDAHHVDRLLDVLARYQLEVGALVVVVVVHVGAQVRHLRDGPLGHLFYYVVEQYHILEERARAKLKSRAVSYFRGMKYKFSLLREKKVLTAPISAVFDVRSCRSDLRRGRAYHYQRGILVTINS